MAFLVILFPDENWNDVDNESVEFVPMLNDGNFEELIAVDGWHEFKPNVLEDNPELVTVCTWKVYEAVVAGAGAGAVVGTKEFKRNGVEDASVDILFVVPNLNPVDCNCSKLVPRRLVDGYSDCAKVVVVLILKPNHKFNLWICQFQNPS